MSVAATLVAPLRPLRCARVAVVGAGAAGLAAARELRAEGHDVAVLEASDHVGGTWRYKGLRYSRFKGAFFELFPRGLKTFKGHIDDQFSSQKKVSALPGRMSPSSHGARSMPRARARAKPLPPRTSAAASERGVSHPPVRKLCAGTAWRLLRDMRGGAHACVQPTKRLPVPGSGAHQVRAVPNRVSSCLLRRERRQR